MQKCLLSKSFVLMDDKDCEESILFVMAEKHTDEITFSPSIQLLRKRKKQNKKQKMTPSSS